MSSTVQSVTCLSSPPRRVERISALQAPLQVLTEREEKASVAIATNESFSGWTKTFTDPRLCAAIVDRLTFKGTIVETGTDSYRLAHTLQQTP
jgi:DNA replication protein DnaC